MHKTKGLELAMHTLFLLLFLTVCESSKSQFEENFKLTLYNVNGTLDKTSIPPNVSVKTLEISSSNIKKINKNFMARLPELESLIITSNPNFPKLTKNFFKTCASLKRLKIDHNQNLRIEDNAFRSLTNLKSLNIEYQEYKKITKNLFKLLNLTALSMIHCGIENVEYDAFSNLKHLEQLHLSYNNISGFKRYTFKGLNKLKDLWLHFNRLGNLKWNQFDKMAAVTFVDMAANNMTKFDVQKMMKVFPSLKKVNLLSNKFTKEEEKKILDNLARVGVEEARYNYGVPLHAYEYAYNM